MHIPALDVDHLIYQTQGDEALERQLLSLFRAQARTILNNLHNDPFAPDQRNIDFAHLLKGAALAIGASHVAAMAAAYENLISHSHRGSLSTVLAELEQAIEEAIEAIDQRIGAPVREN